jgi:hypothetical protein
MTLARLPKKTGQEGWTMADEAQEGETAPVEKRTAANRYTADARKRIAVLRAMAEDFADADRRPLRPTEIRLARHTSAVALEKGALFAEGAPEVGESVVKPMEVRDVIAYELAYGGVRDAALALARSIDHGILRRKLKAVLAVRALYRMAKGYATTDAGDRVQLHVAELKRALVVPRRRKAAATTPADDEK